MNPIRVQRERMLNVSPQEVYGFLRDYTKRPLILPPNYLDYRIDKGGYGAGTVVSYRLHAAGRERNYRVLVDEPYQGALTERDISSSMVTTWLVAPLGIGQQTRVTIISQWMGGDGLGGLFESTMAPMGLRGIYDQMLDRLTTVLHSSASYMDEDRDGLASWAGRLVLLAGAATLAGIVSVIRKQGRHY